MLFYTDRDGVLYTPEDNAKLTDQKGMTAHDNVNSSQIDSDRNDSLAHNVACLINY